MMNQTVMPGNPGDILYFMRVLLFVAFLSMGYTLSRPTPAGNKEQDQLLIDTTGLDSPGQEGTALPPWQRKASDRAVVKYAAAQDKKWRSWNEAMFERLS